MHVLSQLVEGFRFRLLNRFVIIFQQGCVLAAAAGCCAIQTRNIHVDNGTYEEEHYLLNQLMIYHATKILNRNSPVVIPPNKNNKKPLLYTGILCTTLTKRHYSKFTVSPETIFVVLLQGEFLDQVKMKSYKLEYVSYKYKSIFYYRY